MQQKQLEHVGRAVLLALALSLSPLAENSVLRAQAGAPSTTMAQDSPAIGANILDRRFPAELNLLLAALPADTETVTVARDFRFRDDESLDGSARKDEPDEPLIPPSVFDTVVVPRTIASAKPPRLVREWLLGRRVKLLVTGGRDYQITSAFGSLVYEAAAVFVLSEPLGAEKEDWLRSLSVERTSSRMLAGREVSVFPLDRSNRESHVADRKWEGVFIVLLDERTIVTATSDRYLEQFLRRLDADPHTDPAPVLRLHEHLSSDDDAWLIRIPAANDQTRRLAQRRLFASVLWRWRSDSSPNFIGRYLPTESRPLGDVRRAIVSYFERGTEAPVADALKHEEYDGAVLLQMDFTHLEPKKSPADANLLTNFAFLFLRQHPGFY